MAIDGKCVRGTARVAAAGAALRAGSQDVMLVDHVATSEATSALVDQRIGLTRPTLARLARAHLLEQHQHKRWRMHDLVRIFAREHSAANTTEDQSEQAFQRVIDYYRETLNAAWSMIGGEHRNEAPRQFADSAAAHEWVQEERHDLVATVAAAPTPPETIHLALALAGFLEGGRHFEDWVTTAGLAVSATQDLDESVLQTEALHSLASALVAARRFDEAILARQQLLAVCLEREDRLGEALTRTNLGVTLFAMRRFDEAIAFHRQALAICQDLDDREAEARTSCERPRRRR